MARYLLADPADGRLPESKGDAFRSLHAECCSGTNVFSFDIAFKKKTWLDHYTTLSDKKDKLSTKSPVVVFLQKLPTLHDKVLPLLAEVGHF